MVRLKIFGSDQPQPRWSMVLVYLPTKLDHLWGECSSIYQHHGSSGQDKYKHIGWDHRMTNMLILSKKHTTMWAPPSSWFTKPHLSMVIYQKPTRELVVTNQLNAIEPGPTLSVHQWWNVDEVSPSYPLEIKHSSGKSPFLMGQLSINGHFP